LPVCLQGAWPEGTRGACPRPGSGVLGFVLPGCLKVGAGGDTRSMSPSGVRSRWVRFAGLSARRVAGGDTRSMSPSGVRSPWVCFAGLSEGGGRRGHAEHVPVRGPESLGSFCRFVCKARGRRGHAEHVPIRSGAAPAGVSEFAHRWSRAERNTETGDSWG
jgi:hypothetical protein